jgi:hypothetical protein
MMVRTESQLWSNDGKNGDGLCFELKDGCHVEGRVNGATKRDAREHGAR